MSVQAMAKLLGLNRPERLEHRYDDEQLLQYIFFAVGVLQGRIFQYIVHI